MQSLLDNIKYNKELNLGINYTYSNINFSQLFDMEGVTYKDKLVFNAMLKEKNRFQNLTLKEMFIGLLNEGKINNYKYVVWEIAKFINQNDNGTIYLEIINDLEKYNTVKNTILDNQDIIDDNNHSYVRINYKNNLENIIKNNLLTYIYTHYLSDVHINKLDKSVIAKFLVNNNLINKPLFDIKELLIIYLSLGAFNNNSSSLEIANFLKTNIKDVHNVMDKYDNCRQDYQEYTRKFIKSK